MIAMHRKDPRTSSKLPLFEHLQMQLKLLVPYVQNEADSMTLQHLHRIANERRGDADWLRQTFAKRGSLNDMMRLSSALWMGQEQE